MRPLPAQTLTYDYKIEEMVKEPLDQLKGLVRLYAGKDMEIAMDGGKATVTLPPASTMTAAGCSGAGGSSTKASNSSRAFLRLFLLRRSRSRRRRKSNPVLFF